MGNSTPSSRRQRAVAPAAPVLLPVCDTVSGHKAALDADGTVRHYDLLATRLWLSPRVQELTDGLLAHIRSGRTRWASISGPYGYGKTAAGVAAWRHARQEGFTAIPPLSCSNFDELARGVVAIASAQHPKVAGRIERAVRRIWDRGLDDAAKTDAERYKIPGRTVRRMLQDKVRAGQIAIDSQCHRLVELLSELGKIVAEVSGGLVLILDELQQLLGPLDTRAITQFREFVWGMRTEQSPCGVIVCFDAMLEARLARWAADLLHRIRESGPALQLTDVYTSEFPAWLWGRLTSGDGRVTDPGAIDPYVLLSLGQFVERPDLANGPRTVVDVFCRAIEHYRSSHTAYGLDELVVDVQSGVMRYFGEGAQVQRTLTELLKDDWLRADPVRVAVVRRLAAFPRGCPKAVAEEAAGSAARLAKVRSQLFAPLLVELPDGLALERLQQIRRPVIDWEQVVARAWETLPALDALLAHAPDMVWRVLGSRLFPEAPGSDAHWERTSGDVETALTGWRYLRGTFDEDYPSRDVALWIGPAAPTDWPADVDLALAFTCAGELGAEASATPDFQNPVPRVTFTMPLLRPLAGVVPAELDRFKKYIQPEPFKALTVINAIHDLSSIAEPENTGASSGPASFIDVTMEFVEREILQGMVNLLPKVSVQQRGPELVRALFTAACRKKSPGYRTLIKHHNWTEPLKAYRNALRLNYLTDVQRRGEVAVTGTKAELARTLFEQKSVAAWDSQLRLLGPLVETAGTADSFSIHFACHPGEAILHEYVTKAGRKRAVPVSAVHEVMRHAGYLPSEADSLVGLLTDRGLLAAVAGGVRPVGRERAGQDEANAEIESLLERLRRIGVSDIPSAPASEATPALWAYADVLKERLATTVQRVLGEITARQTKFRDSTGLVKAEIVPTEWAESCVSTHLRGIGKLLLRSREAILKSLTRELDKITAELGEAAENREDWVAAWRKRASALERVWDGVGARCAEFRTQAGHLRQWQALNERIAAIQEMGAKIGGSDPGLARTIAEMMADLREQLATESWEPVFAHQDVATRLGEVERQAHGILFSRVRAYLREAETLRSRFGEFLTGSQPEIDGEPHSEKLYAWASDCFAAARTRLTDRSKAGQPWQHPTRKSQRWADVADQLTRAVEALKPSPNFAALTHMGELLLTARRGFLTAAASRGEFVLDRPEHAGDIAGLAELIATGQIRVRVEWTDKPAPTQDRKA
ncbi:MAG: hypothetical protein C0501_14330 [Isosphaera sp.]|nr:hypothetical protein [Isosphaera sp.]